MGRKVRTFDEMSDKVLTCRAGRRHPMELSMSVLIRIDRKDGLVYHWRCISCQTERHDTVVANHREKKIERLSRKYIRADGVAYDIEKLDDWGGRLVFNENVQYEFFVRAMKNAKGVKKKR